MSGRSKPKPFHNTLNYASTANIEEVMKFYNLSHKTFETDFNFKWHSVICLVSDLAKITDCNMNFDFDDLELRETPGGSGNIMI